MVRKMLIDAAHPEETRVVVVDGTRVDEFDFEAQARRQLRGNIYLARVTRVEPSLQAAFVEYGGNRHGFLAFNEIHPDYYQIPYEDRAKLIAEERAAAQEAEEAAEAADEGEDDEAAAEQRRRRAAQRRYKIQEVIKRRQILLVQVVKEERGNKGAALTTYLSLAGRYCVLMPNTGRGGGVSRKITSATDRKRLRKMTQDLDVPEGMGLIVRTAGAKRTKTEIKRDYDYLLRLWETIREKTLGSIAPCLIYEESDLVKRAIRDLYDKDIEAVLVEGEPAYREAKDFIRMLMPSHAKKVQHYKDKVPLFLRHRVEEQLDQIYSPTVQLKSGGYIVINQTEALVAIDVNSGRATRERNIEATALKTNLEAADEAARQFRLRDLAGLLVIDFIDMEEAKNVRAVEKRVRDALKRDRARIQVGKISQFGLLEMSRQRRRTSILEGSHTPCPTCRGRGIMRSVESSALHVLRRIEEEGLAGKARRVAVRTAPEVALYLLNEKRGSLNAVEERFGVHVMVVSDANLVPPECEIERVEARGPDDAIASALDTPPDILVEDEPDIVEEPDVEDEDEDEDVEAGDDGEDGEDRAAADEEGGRKRRRRRRRRGRGGGEGARPEEAETTEAAEESEESRETETIGEEGEEHPADSDGGERPKRRRRRGRRGGRGRRSGEGAPATGEEAPSGMEVIDPEAETALQEAEPEAEEAEVEAEETVDAAPEAEPEAEPEPKPKPARRSRARKPKAEPKPEPQTEPEPEPVAAETVAAGGDSEPAQRARVVIDPEEPAEPAPDDKERRSRWQDRLKGWI